MFDPWTKEEEAWLWENREKPAAQIYKEYCEKFPERHRTVNALYKRRCYKKMTVKHSDGHSTRKRPLYSERERSGIIEIKTGPNQWTSKARYIWNQVHPEALCEPKVHEIIHLDGDLRNNDISNLMRVEYKIARIACRKPLPKGKPEVVKRLIAQAKLRLAMGNAAESLGIVKVYTRHQNGRLERQIDWSKIIEE